MQRSLSPDEAALWSRVMASVRPLRAAPVSARSPEPVPPPATAAAPPPARRVKGRVPSPLVRAAAPPTPIATNTLDGGWDKRLSRGAVIPDATVDLHGHTLGSAHDLLDHALSRALARGDRVLLLVTGRPPRAESERPHARGAIRAAVGDWLAASRHDRHIAAVRHAHPRHGGAGALYLILRRSRELRG